MNAFLRRLFHIYPGEEKSAYLFAILGFLWSLAVTSGLKFADALFLLHVGAESLPIVYSLTACGMVVLAAFLLYAFNVFDIYKIFLGVIVTGISFYIFAFFCLQYHIGIENKWLWFALRICGSLFFSVCITCYWTFIDQYYTLQDAKRLYSPFCAMVFLGVATTGMIMRAGLIDFQHLTVFICAILLLTAGWILHIVKTIPMVNDEKEAFDSQPQPGNRIGSILVQILKSRFTLLLMAGNFITYLLLVITEYNYMLSFDEYFDPGIIEATGDEQNAALTMFLGQCLAAVSITNLVFGLFFYSRLVRRFGVGSMLFVTPAILILTFTGWLSMDTLLFPVMGLFVVEGTLYVVDDSNFNLLLNAVPSKLKYKIRVAIESFFEPIGMLLSSFLLSLAWIDSRLLGLVLAGGSLVIAWLLKKNYTRAVYANLTDNAIHFQRSLVDWFRLMPQKELKQTQARLLSTLKHGSLKEQRDAYEAICVMQEAHTTEKAQRLLSTFTPQQQQQITAVSVPTGISLPANSKALIETLQDSSDNEIRMACLHALGRQGDISIVAPLIAASTHFRPNERRLTESVLVAFGPQVNNQVLDILRNPHNHDRCRMLAGRVLGSLNVDLLRKHLHEVIEQEIKRAHFYFFHAHTLKDEIPGQDLSLLKDTLMTGYRSVMDFIIQLLGSAGEVEDCELLARCQRSHNPKTRSQVLETLERSCETPIFKLLYPLVSESPQEVKLSGYMSTGGVQLSLAELLDHMCESPSQLDRIVACVFKFRYQSNDWRDALQQHLQSEDMIIKHFAQELLAT